MIKILSVDDKPLNHNVLEFDIQEYMNNNDLFEFEIIKANSGIEAIKKAKEYLPHIIFMDIMMPFMDGFEATVKLKNNIDTKDIKIIVVTALNDFESKEKAKLSGANGFITKPFKYNAIQAILERYIDIDKYKNIKISSENSFLEFGDDNLFEDDKTKLKMNYFNNSHKKVTANEFLSDFSDSDLKEYLDEIDEIQYLISENIDSLYENNLHYEIRNIIITINYCKIFLNNFYEFNELYTALGLLEEKLSYIDFVSLTQNNKIYICEFIKAILHDANIWFDLVFIKKEAVDVYYINASMLNSCFQLQSLIGENQ